MENQNLQAAQSAKLQKKEITDLVMLSISNQIENGEIIVNKDYTWVNEIKLAWLMFLELVDKNKQPAISVCTKESIVNAFIKMIVSGLHVSKKQVYFIVHGNKLTLMDSYFGTMSKLERAVNVLSIGNMVVFEGDQFEIGVNPEIGRYEVFSHKTKPENFDISKINYAYSIIRYEKNGVEQKSVAIMTKAQIILAWKQGYGYSDNSKVHNNFTDEMCKKTVFSRNAKLIVNSSNDEDLMNQNDDLPILTSSKELEVFDFDKETGEIFTEQPKQIEAPKVETKIISKKKETEEEMKLPF